MNRLAFYRRPLPYRFLNVTLFLIILNVGMFLLTNFLFPRFRIYLALIPTFVLQANAWWQLLTYMFIHAGFSHIFFNMLALFLFGTRLEQRLGSYEFLVFYLVCGIGSGLVTVLINSATGMGIVPVVGASGAIYGLLLAFAVLFPDAVIFVFFIPMRARTAVLVFAGIELVSSI